MLTFRPAVLISIVASGLALAQQPPEKAVIEGKVVPTDEEIWA